MSTDIIEVSAMNNTPTIFSVNPENKMTAAIQVANILKDFVVKQGLVERIGKKDYIKFEGWAAMGGMLGILPSERSVTRNTDGSYEAYVDLVRMSDGVVIGSGSAICGMDESKWRSSQEFARRSMAITRASGKAYRLSFCWIMALAGYQPTPAEEASVLDDEPRQTAIVYDSLNPTQKMILAESAKRHGITEKKDLIEISNAMTGKPMMELERVVKTYAETVPADVGHQ